MKKASLNAEICTIKDNKPSQAHVSDSAPENIKEMHIIDTLKRENTNDGSVSKPSKTCKKSKESPQDTSECSTKRDKKKEVDDIWQDITVGKISVKGITTVKGKSKKLSKKKQGGKNGQPKLMVNKIKEVRSERKVDSNKPGRKKKKSQKKQVLNDLSKDKDGKVSGKSDKLDEYCDLGNELENVGKSKAPLNKNNSAEIVAGETSPFSDVIHDKEMKRKLFPKRVTEAAEDANDDKENMEQTSQQAAKKSSSTLRHPQDTKELQRCCGHLWAFWRSLQYTFMENLASAMASSPSSEFVTMDIPAISSVSVASIVPTVIALEVPAPIS
ncbi:cylicin-2-like [Macrobrachium rosenbergii]|uniref:cylicin-2-like n=1 Tax=Macrobrachium rosenbergii TaxID=79674 RepID=UPI0034D61359